ncbi:MAG TPA: hypothetical protein VGJ13_08455 [Pseudonocardiaceae bacterium]
MAGLVDLLAHRAARVALAHREIAVVFGILCAAGVSQTRIGEATRLRQSDVSAIRPAPTPVPGRIGLTDVEQVAPPPSG